MDILDNLNPEQHAAVTHVDGPLLVVAGAGTGKTQVITRRIAHLIRRGHAKPEEVLALTFTEKASREMADRLYGLIGWESFSVPVMTFNAFGAELLARFNHHIGRSIRGGLLNDTQKSLLLKQHIHELNFDYYGVQSDWYEFSANLVGYIGRLQNAGVTVEAYADFVEHLGAEPGDRHPADVAEQRDLLAVYQLYERLKETTATYDYYDQLALPLRILAARPNVAERLRTQYRYILVDEYQDTSPVQDDLLRQLVAPGGNLFAVGDDDQAIYGFRGADISGILRFAEHFQVEKPVALVQNYRSGQPILDASYRLIRHNDPDRLESRLGLNKRLVAQTATADVSFAPYARPADEQAAVVEAIAGRLAAGENPGSVAVLARSNATLQAYAKALRTRGIPFAISTAVNIFEQRELINLWYILEWVGGVASDEAIGHIALGPLVGWSAAEWRAVVQRSADDLTGVEVSLRALAREGDTAAAELVARLDTWRGWAAAETVTRLAVRIVSEATDDGASSIIEQLQHQAEGGRETRVLRVFDDLQRFLGQTEAFAEIQLLAGGDMSLAGYLTQFPQPPKLEVAETVGDAEGVQLLTIHASKGLEFDTVYVVNTTARAWSDNNGPAGGLAVPEELAPPSDLPGVHEQRRLMYVAATRARTNLQISSPIGTAGGQRQQPSPLVGELLGGDPEPVIAQQQAEATEEVMQKLQRFYPLQQEMPARLPFETADGWIELGVGDLDNFDKYPHDFYLQKVLGISRPFGPQLAFGTAVHRAIERFYKTRMETGSIPELEELIGCVEEAWNDRGYETREQAEAGLKRARDTVARFYDREAGFDRHVLSSEKPIIFEVPEAKLRLRGRIDATFALDGGMEVRDFKTGMIHDVEKLEKRAKDSFQLRTYALAIEELSGAAPAAVTLDYVVTGAEGSAKLSPLILKNHRKKLVELATKLRERDFAPKAASGPVALAAFKYYGDDDEPHAEA